jgi:hypothetical protein
VQLVQMAQQLKFIYHIKFSNCNCNKKPASFWQSSLLFATNLISCSIEHRYRLCAQYLSNVCTVKGLNSWQPLFVFDGHTALVGQMVLWLGRTLITTSAKLPILMAHNVTIRSIRFRPRI